MSIGHPPLEGVQRSGRPGSTKIRINFEFSYQIFSPDLLALPSLSGMSIALPLHWRGALKAGWFIPT
jgi:hypothetical protein